MKIELKPCPFCNGQAKIGIKRESAGMDGSYANWIIHCEKCGAMISCPADGFYGRKALTEDEAIEAWNRRVSDALSQPEIVRCGECVHYRPTSSYWGKCCVHSSPTEKYRTCQICDYCSWAEKKEDKSQYIKNKLSTL